jgi:hypothetical protein
MSTKTTQGQDLTDAPQPIKKGEMTYLPLPLGTEVPEDVHFSVWWGQKTLPTKIFTALSGEDISQTSGERKTTFAKGGEIVFDNGQIPLERTLAGTVKTSRHDAFIPTAHRQASKSATAITAASPKASRRRSAAA